MAKLRAAGQAPPPRPACELLPTSTSASVSSHCVTSIPGSLASDDCHLILSHDSGAEQTQPQVSLGSLVGLQSGDCCAGMPMMPLPPATGGQTRASVCVSVSHTHIHTHTHTHTSGFVPRTPSGPCAPRPCRPQPEALVAQTMKGTGCPPGLGTRGDATGEPPARRRLALEPSVQGSLPFHLKGRVSSWLGNKLPFISGLELLAKVTPCSADIFGLGSLPRGLCGRCFTLLEENTRPDCAQVTEHVGRAPLCPGWALRQQGEVQLCPQSQAPQGRGQQAARGPSSHHPRVGQGSRRPWMHGGCVGGGLAPGRVTARGAQGRRTGGNRSRGCRAQAAGSCCAGGALRDRPPGQVSPQTGGPA